MITSNLSYFPLHPQDLKDGLFDPDILCPFQGHFLSFLGHLVSVVDLETLTSSYSGIFLNKSSITSTIFSLCFPWFPKVRIGNFEFFKTLYHLVLLFKVFPIVIPNLILNFSLCELCFPSPGALFQSPLVPCGTFCPVTSPPVYLLPQHHIFTGMPGSFMCQGPSLRVCFQKQSMMVHTFDLSTLEAEVGRSLLVQGRQGLQIESQGSQWDPFINKTNKTVITKTYIIRCRCPAQRSPSKHCFPCGDSPTSLTTARCLRVSCARSHRHQSLVTWTCNKSLDKDQLS